MFRSTKSSLLAVLCLSALSLAAPAAAQTIDYQILRDQVGSGLQTTVCRARLSTGAHGGITMRIESADTNLVLVTDDDETPGTAFVDVFVPNGTQNVDFYLQAKEDTTGTADLTSSAPGFASATVPIDVVQPGVRKLGLPSAMDPFDPVDAFTLQVGVPNGTNTTITFPQRVRVGGPGLTSTVSVTDPALATLVTTGETGPLIALPIPPGANSTPSTVGSGGIGLDALAPGTVGVIATVPGFITIAPDTQMVTVDPTEMTFTSTPYQVGAGLQLESRSVQLSGSQHGGVTVHFEVSDSTLVLLAPDANSPGAGTLDVFVPDGQLYAYFVMQGLEGVTGTPFVTVSAPGFGNEVAPVEVKTPAYRLLNLGTGIDTLDPPDNFQVSVGIPNGTLSNLQLYQPVRVGGPGVEATVFLDDGSVGQILTQSASGDTVTMVIPEGESSSPTTLGNGGLAFDGVGVGMTEVGMSIPGFVPVATATVEVTVSQPSLTINSGQGTVGAGLRSSGNGVFLGASQHGGVTVRVESLDPGLLLVSAHGDSLGQSFVEIDLANGLTSLSFYSHAFEDTTGTVPIAVTSPLFLPDTLVVEVVAPAARLVGLTPTLDTLDPPDAVYAIVGYPISNFNSVVAQEVRPGSAGVPVEFTVSDPAVGTMVAPVDTAATVFLTIPPGASNTPTTVGQGGAAFDGIAAGTTTVSVSVPGGVPVNLSSGDVTVTAPTIAFSTIDRVGWGLQDGQTATLSASSHGGTLITLVSSDPSVLLLSPDVVTPGQASIEVFAADGQTLAPFFIHGVDGQTGTVDVTVSAPQFLSNQLSISVEQPAVELVALGATLDVADSPDNFYARVGLPSADNTTVAPAYIQERRAGQPPLVVTVASSDGAVAGLVTQSASGDSIAMSIPAGENATPINVASGGIALDGLSPGEVLVTASVPGFVQTGDAQVTVDVTNQNITLNGLATRLGAGLQSPAVAAELGESGHGGITVTIAVSDTNLAYVAANALAVGGGSLQVAVPGGQTEALFYLQAREGSTGQQVTVTASAPGFSTAMQVVDLVPAATALTQLADSMDVNVDDEFVVQIGAITADGTGIVEPQAVRGGAAPRNVTVRVDDPVLARFANMAGPADSLTVTFDPGEQQTPPTVAAGGVAFDPLAPGTVVVSASGPDIVASDAGVLAVQLTGEVTTVDNVVPGVTRLVGNHPNPFNPRTRIVFELAAPSNVSLRVYDVAGRLVRTIERDRAMAAGRHESIWDGRDDRGAASAAGLYIYRLEAGDYRKAQRMMLLK